MIKVSGALQKSTIVMKDVNDLIKLPELQKTMMEMSKGERGSCNPACVLSAQKR
jgi:hypothetical protein